GRAEELAEASEAADDFVHDHQDAGAIAQLTDLLEVVHRTRRDTAAGVLDRLGDDRCDLLRSLEFNGSLDFVVTDQGAGAGVLAIRATIAVRHRYVPSSGHERTGRGAGTDQPIDRERAHRRAVIGATTRERFPPVWKPAQRLVLLRQLEGALD